MPPAAQLLGADVEKTRSDDEYGPIVRQFEISDPIAKACWYKDGTQIYPKKEPGSESQSSSNSSSSSEFLAQQSPDLSGERSEIWADSQAVMDVKGGFRNISALMSFLLHT